VIVIEKVEESLAVTPAVTANNYGIAYESVTIDWYPANANAGCAEADSAKRYGCFAES
jgi:hypothetical protein